MILKCFYDDFRMNLVCFWDDFNVIWDDSGMLVRWFWNAFGMIMG